MSAASISDFNAEHRFGSADWASRRDLKRAGLLDSKGLQIGFAGDRPLHLDGDGPIITFAGARSGKLRDILGYVVCRSPGHRMMVLDPRGELFAISHHVHAAHGDHAYGWGPFGLRMATRPLPHKPCNPLSILRPESPTVHADCAFVAEALITPKPNTNEPYFNQRAQDWTCAFLKHLTFRFGYASLPLFYELVNAIEGDPKVCADHLEVMLASAFDDVRRTAAELLAKQQDSEKEFSAIMGEMYAHLRFLNDPLVRDALEDGPDSFTLDVLCDPAQPAKVFLNVPAEYLGILSPVMRLFFTAAMLHKTRNPQAPRVLLLVDEAGQLGKFDALLRSFTFGAGAGIRTWALFQDLGQISSNYGAPALQSFLGSAQCRQFFGVRDYETAKVVSDMLGEETLRYDDEARQREAATRRNALRRDILDGVDPFDRARDYAHEEWRAGFRDHKARRLLTPDEVMHLPEDRQILFISGLGLKPVMGHRHPYFRQRDMAGWFLPNPQHPPLDRVKVRTFWGERWRDVVTEPVPEKWSGFPQHADGSRSYVRGYKL